jgi:hypothetical protein
MKLLHILKSTPDETTRTLMDLVSEEADATVFRLYEGAADYEALIDAVFGHDRVISWW